MKDLIKNKKIVIIDVHSCTEGDNVSDILKVVATKIENGEIGEVFYSDVVCEDGIDTLVYNSRCTNNEKNNLDIKAVLEHFRDFIKGYTVYARHSGAVNRLLTYHGLKNGVKVGLAVPFYFDEISRYLNSQDVARVWFHSGKEDTEIPARMVINKFFKNKNSCLKKAGGNIGNVMKGILKDKNIVIIDVETSGAFCGENGKKPANILRIDATKIENGKLGETFSSLVATDDIIPEFVANLVGITNEMMKDAPTLKEVLTDFKEFIKGYTVYARNSAFINKFLTYHGLKNGIEIPMAMYDYYDNVSKFLHERDIADCLEISEEVETVKLAKALIKNIDKYDFINNF